MYETEPLATFARTPGDGLDGFAAEAVVRPASWFTLMPRNWSFVEAATLPTAGLTAWRAIVVEGRTQADHDVLVLGTGAVSIFALQFAKKMGGRVIVTSSSDEKLERARVLGADFCVNYLRHENWSGRVLELTEGRGVDLVVETAGPGTLPQSIKATRIGGHIILIGVLTGLSLRLLLRHDSFPTLVLRQEQQERAQRDELECPSPPSFQRLFSLQAPVQSGL